MIVSVVGMPGATVARASAAEARRRLAESDFLLVDVHVGDEPSADARPVVKELGLEHESPKWFGRTEEPARADYVGHSAGFVVPVVEKGHVSHVHMLATERHIVALHRGPARSLRAVIERLEAENPADTPAMLFLLLQEALDTFRREATKYLLQVEDLEDAMFERRRPEQIYRLTRLRRRAAVLHRFLLPYLQATEEMFGRRMVNRDFPEERLRLVQEFQHTGRLALNDIEALQEATRRAFAGYSSLVAGEQNGVINRLAIVSTIFLPLSFLTGYFGMNFTYLTDVIQSRVLFWLLAVGLQVGVLVVALYVLHRTHIWRRFRSDDGIEE
ncbi:CorA family divalent cation transporter [Streptomyces sp. J2-1]|uniref:CorA family divalent cation transporter n=1 Tax=Streptomyces corallincola TaxID=2851888 RepID=UPI001C37F4A4|nr:CorA family divalent cation transporter [Streptomyces corallincola]MBV2354996.1 CorA family divalent cation transporter [Streptomyces corallincola]